MDNPEKYKILHDEIFREHQLISNRLTWYVTSQSFLMTVYAIVLGKDNQGAFMARWLIPSLGLLISVSILFSIYAALRAMADTKDRITPLAQEPEFKDLPVCGEKPWVHFLGMLPPRVIPVLFLVTWLLLLGHSWTPGDPATNPPTFSISPEPGTSTTITTSGSNAQNVKWKLNSQSATMPQSTTLPPTAPQSTPPLHPALSPETPK